MMQSHIQAILSIDLVYSFERQFGEEKKRVMLFT